ncbi:VWA domain-containing protein [Roseibium sp. MMSF_3544]|uniref:vWA domain-containing protein n=1 Tax=unclassified Roseibium TaxID=2629323 RepID=UPI00273E6880|nr:VWA domain-containing protein [Roseibium sp. MMSF_3544]
MSRDINRYLSLAILAVLFPILMLAKATAVQAAERAIVVFDGSGSMWGQIRGKTKIEIAREVMKQSLPGWAERDVDMGLIAYGHRQKGACGDIEVLIPPKPLDVGQFSAALDSVSPKGKTPLTAAVRMAAEELRFTEEKATVILLSDGLETCDLDPCAVSRELEGLGVDFTAHVIGFDVAEPEERAQLSCIAENTGGLFVTASNAEELSTAFEQVAALNPATFIAVDAAQGNPVPGPVTWSISGGNVAINTASSSEALDVADVPSGSYRVEAVAGPYKGATTIEIGDVRNSPFRIALEAQLPDATIQAQDTVPALETFSVSWTGPAAAQDQIQLARPGSVPGSSYVQTVDVSAGPVVTMTAPDTQGPYELRYYSAQFGKLLATRKITVGKPAPGARMNALDEIPAGHMLEVAWEGPGGANDWIDIAPPDLPNGNGYLSYTFVNSGNPLMVRAPSKPGVYELRYINGSDRQIMGSRKLVVGDGGISLNALDTVKAGETLEVAWTGPGIKVDWIDIAPPGLPNGNGYLSYTFVNSGNPLTVRAPSAPGTYEIRYINGSDRQIMGTKTLVVGDGGISLNALDTVQAGETVEVAWEGPGHKSDWIDIAPPDLPNGNGYLSYTFVNAGNPLTVRAPSAPGTYELRYINGSDRQIMGTKTLVVGEGGLSLNALDTVKAGETVEIAWEGPGNKSDWIDIAPQGLPNGNGYLSYTFVNAGNPLTVRAPSEPGTYDIRYINGSDRQIMATRQLVVGDGGIKLNALDAVKAGETLEVAWEGPGNKSDWIDIAPPDLPNGNGYLSYTFVNRGNPLTVRAPSAPGTYELRYINGSDRQIMGKRQLVVGDGGISLNAVDEIKAGETLEVAWEGPGHQSDWIDIAPPGLPNGNGYLSYTFVNRGNPVEVRVPSAPGSYVIRYINGSDRQIMGTRTLSVTGLD